MTEAGVPRQLAALWTVQGAVALALFSWGLVRLGVPASGDDRFAAGATLLGLCGAAVALWGALFVHRLGRGLIAVSRLAQAAASGDLPSGGGADVRGAEAVPQLTRVLDRLMGAIRYRDESLRDTLRVAARERERVQAIIEATSDGLVIYDAQRRILAVNSRAAELLGFPAELMTTAELGELELDLQHRVRWPRLYRERLEAHFGAPERQHRDVLEIERPRRRVLRRSSAPVHDKGEICGRVFTYTDVTTDVELQRLKDEFVAMASHELRTPLTSIHGALQLAMEGSGAAMAPGDRELLDISLASTDRLVRLVNDLLDLSRIEAGRMPIRAVPVDVFALADEAVRAMRPIASGRGSRVLLNTGARPAASIRSDRDQIVRVLVNLIGNAIKYSPGGSTVTVAVEGRPEAVRMTVADEGPGIPAAQLSRLFRPFSRLGTEGRSQDGTGLGLAISRALVEQLDGRIWVEAAWPTGARFVVELPTSVHVKPSTDAGAVAGLR